MPFRKSRGLSKLFNLALALLLHDMTGDGYGRVYN